MHLRGYILGYWSGIHKVHRVHRDTQIRVPADGVSENYFSADGVT